jgi:hypothetical protein
MVAEKLIDEKDAPDKAGNLLNVIKTAFLQKKLTYKSFKWNAKEGIIQNIICIKYDKETGGFFTTLQDNLPKPKEDKEPKSKKKVSVRTIITKDNERIVNEEVLNYLVTKLQKDKNPTREKADKEECIERIKNKLFVKKITANDKIIIGEIYENIFNVVVANK